jgi:hypothetical protein
MGNICSLNEYTEIAIVGTNVTTFVDFTVADTTVYTYRVRAWSSSAYYSRYSNPAEVMTLIPVELISFKADIAEGNVELTWSTATETNNLGFEIYKTIKSSQPDWKKIGFIQGHGTTTEVQSYSFKDESTLSGTYLYKLKQIDYDGSFEYSNIVEAEILAPTKFSLEQNYPNPFNPSTNIKYEIPGQAWNDKLFVTLKVYDVLGNEVATPVNEEKPAGVYEIKFSTADFNLPSGVYFYQIKAGNYADTKKMIILK